MWGSQDRLGVDSLGGKSMASGLFIHHLWVEFTGNSISQTQSLISMKFFFRVRSM